MKDHKLELNGLAISALRESAKWCMFLAIVGFIFITLMVVMGAVMSVVMSAMPTDPYGGAMTGPMASNPIFAMKSYFGIMYIVLAVIYFMPVYYLFNYAKGMKQALESANEDVLSRALVNLKSHHKFLGIFTIIMIALYIIGIIAVAVFAASFARAM